MRPGAITRRQVVVGAGAASLGLLTGCGRLPWQPPEPSKIPRIGFLGDDDTTSNDRVGLRQGLQQLGYVEGQTIEVVERFAASDLRQDRSAALRRLADELVALDPAVLVAASVPHTRAFIEATKTIPIVFVLHPDPVGAGHVASLARPGGNVTGTSFLNTGMSGKRLELLQGAVPHVTRVASLGPPEGPSSTLEIDEARAAAASLGLQLQVVGVRSPEEFDAAFEAITAEQAEALVMRPGGPLLGPVVGRRIIELAAQKKLPTMGTNRQYADAGGLMAYGANQDVIRRRSAYYVDRILKGAKPADLPIEQPMTFEFVLNLTTAEALGLQLPEATRLQVTEVIR